MSNRRTTRQPNHIGAMSSNFLALFTIQPAWFCRPPPMWCCAQHWSRMFSMWQQGLSNISGSLEKILINALRFIFVQQVIHNNKSVLNISHKRELEWNAQQMSSPNKERAIFSRVKLRPSIDLSLPRCPVAPVTQHIPTMTYSHHGGFLSVMIMVGIWQVTKSHHKWWWRNLFVTITTEMATYSSPELVMDNMLLLLLTMCCLRLVD